MIKKIQILFVLTISLAFFTGSLYADETVALTVKAKGNVKLTKAKDKSRSDLKRGNRLYNDDKITTGKKSYAAVKFVDDNSLVRLRSNSSCTIKGKKEEKGILKNVFLEIGAIFARITKQDSKFQITTPTSVASVKGTQFIGEHKGEKGTYYYGEEGIVEISNKAGTALMRAGETTFVADENTAPVVRKTQPGEKPLFDDYGFGEDQFELQFENEQGQQKLLKFKAKKKD